MDQLESSPSPPPDVPKRAEDKMLAALPSVVDEILKAARAGSRWACDLVMKYGYAPTVEEAASRRKALYGAKRQTPPRAVLAALQRIDTVVLGRSLPAAASRPTDVIDMLEDSSGVRYVPDLADRAAPALAPGGQPDQEAAEKATPTSAGAPLHPNFPQREGQVLTPDRVPLKPLTTRGPWMTVREAARKMHMTTIYVQMLLRAGKLVGRKRGKSDWQVDPASVQGYKPDPEDIGPAGQRAGKRAGAGQWAKAARAVRKEQAASQTDGKLPEIHGDAQDAKDPLTQGTRGCKICAGKLVGRRPTAIYCYQCAAAEKRRKGREAWRKYASRVKEGTGTPQAAGGPEQPLSDLRPDAL